VSQGEIEPEKLTPEMIKELLEKATPVETKYLLKLRRWARQGGAYDDYAEFEVVYGEAEEVTLEEWDSGYPYARGEDVIVIPRRVPTVIYWKHYEDKGDGEMKTRIIYIFTKDGWKSVEL